MTRPSTMKTAKTLHRRANREPVAKVHEDASGNVTVTHHTGPRVAGYVPLKQWVRENAERFPGARGKLEAVLRDR